MNVKSGFSKKIKFIGRIGIALIVPIILIILWQILSDRGLIKQSVLPSPHTIFLAFIDMVKSGDLARNLSISILRVIKGYCIGASLGIICGIFIGLFRIAENAVDLLIGFLRPIPIVAWVPVLILWMGIGEASKITVIVIGSFWPILINTIYGIKGADKKYLEVSEILEKSKLETLEKIVFPSALPSIFTGLRIGIGSAWMSVITAEIIAATSGIGYSISYARELSQPDIMLVGVASIGVIGFLIDYIIKKLQILVVRWDSGS
ncbi:MAG: ABC transporter permease [Clostridium sp.]|jgi:sulfonate transport system permease protein|uniref:ABC transporter permease n=1 Tax=Clostridium sp. TaxID=1506 RepID=UPI0025C65B6D|nr:ABC transporter permease [Clostridium sp.]MCH3965144.1 ABC transporter permease [Clostridium sp.]MCI1714365.1 ABC transporter permease [Clostridium sp.]MCI1798627.1 ABC transporter permease [Clostridium sp.]MCI1812642.1 ABC transporter permease [Clostridium sp.]MCI1869436.1 ABC transporter permease [Clostridium sp.]